MPLAPDRPAARLLVWLGVVPFLIFALLFLILPTLQVVTGAFRTPDGSPTLQNLRGLLTPSILHALALEMTERGHNPEVVAKVSRLLKLSEYKRRQSAPGTKLSPRAFARERRYPIVNGY